MCGWGSHHLCLCYSCPVRDTSRSSGRRVRLEPDLKVGLGISRTSADSQGNPVYNAFHRFFRCGNETIRR